VTAYALTGDPQTWPTLPPIGRPIWNTELFLLDPHGQPVPIGIAGELFISVDDPVRGYINWPELTSDRFLPNLFSQASDVRLYKTGDLARYLFDGNIEFLGRIDNQVKIRGFRIELGEIEAALSQHPAIQQCVMLAREDQPGDKRLVAYVVAEGEAPSTQELQHFLKQTLPDYMIPSVFVPLESLPLTPSGKVDRKVLPTPDRTDFVPSAPYVASRTQLEQKLAKIWAEVLQLEQVGIHDNFFELGGHSLLAAQLIGHLQKATSATIPLQLLFKAPTIAALAQAIEEQIESSTKTEASETTPLPLLLSSIPRAASERQLESISTPFSKIERRPLLSLFTTEYIASVDSVALGYVPAAMLDQFPLSGNELLEIGFGNQPLLNRMIQTEWGRIGLILLPHFSSELYSNQTELIHKIVDALKLAKFLGARTVSLTGLIPSATDYGYGVIKALQGRDDLPRVTTGHATTCSTVVLTIEKIVQLAARDFTKERVGFVGLGSIGASTLRLMLKCLPHPAEITLADIYSKLSVLEAFRQELVDDFGFKGDLRIVESRHEAPSEIYQSTLIVGATNVPDIVDVAQLLPGTLIVDDSAPHCFSADKAIQRFQKRQDILFTEGGVLGSPSPMHTLTYVPPLMDQMMPPNYLESLINRNPHHITGCVFSSLLSAQFEGIEPTLGEIDLHQLLKHFEILKQLKFQAADLHCEDYVLSEEGIQSFRQQFSQLNRNSEYR
jgi:acyl carrier protein/predicted amino acid dehydrogenase